MSDLAAIFVMLAMIGLTSIGSAVAVNRLHQRCDDIMSGVVNGASASPKYRWLILFYDYVGIGFSVTLLFAIMAAGFFSASEFVDSQTARNVAYLCGGAAAWAAFFHTLNVGGWIVHLVSVLRQAEAD